MTKMERKKKGKDNKLDENSMKKYLHLTRYVVLPIELQNPKYGLLEIL